MRKVSLIFSIILLSFPPLWTQSLEPFGLGGKTITALAVTPYLRSTTWPNHLFAAVDSHGVFLRDLLGDSSWVEAGLAGNEITSLHVHHSYTSSISAINEVYAGIQPDKATGDSVLIYKYTPDKTWIPFDSGMDRSNVDGITALGGIYSFDLSFVGALFAGGNGRIYRASYPEWRWSERIVIGEFVHTIQTNQRYWGDENIWAGGSIKENVTPWIAKSEDRGYSWELSSSGVGAAHSILSIAIDFHRSNIIYAVVQSGVLKTIDGGQYWKFITSRNEYDYYSSIVLDSNNPEHVYVGGRTNNDNLLLYESTDGGENWQRIPMNWDRDLPKGITCMAADSKQGGVIYLGTMGNGIWRYQSEEKSIQPNPLGFYPLVKSNKWDYEIDYEEQGTYRYTTEVIGDTLISGIRYYIMKRITAPESEWYVRVDTSTCRIYELSGSEPVEVLTFSLNAKVGEVRGDTLGWRETCAYWEEKNFWGNNVLVKGFVGPAVYGYYGYELAWGFGELTSWYAAHGGISHSRLMGAYINGVSYGSLTSVDNDKRLPAPYLFVLEQNYPNPFNSRTIIRYQLPRAAEVTLEIYNLLGERVRFLIKEQQSSGQHQVVWDGCDAGRDLPSGVYLYRLQADQFTATKRMVLLR